jgi:hypothetical protein
MWKANQSNGFACNKSFYHHHFTGSLKTARKPQKKKTKTHSNKSVIHHILKPAWKNSNKNVCERENFGTKVCMYVHETR